jgi:hypothetical protein
MANTDSALAGVDELNHFPDFGAHGTALEVLNAREQGTIQPE